MDKHKIFANNLNAIRKAREQSLAEFSAELGIPKSILQSVLKNGQTSLNTAIQISEGLNISLDALVGENLSELNLSSFRAILLSLSWFKSLSPDKQVCAVLYLIKLMEVLKK